MPTFTQAMLLGADRLDTVPAAPHASLAEAWSRLDWAGSRETALLEASALAGVARGAGGLPAGPLPAPAAAPPDGQGLPPLRAIAVLRQLLAEASRPLLPEWIEHCARHGQRVPPFFLRTLFELVTAPAERASLLRVVGERGRWLARQNPDWAWVVSVGPAPEASLWETGNEEERLAALRHLRAADPPTALPLVEKTWADDTPDFRVRVLGLLAEKPAPSDESFLQRALGDRRKDVRTLAQAMLATLPGAGLATRMQVRAERLFSLQRGLLGKKLEVNLPEAFDASWKSDAIEEKPPAGVGAKAYWAQQILGLVPVAHWTEKFRLDAVGLVALAQKSTDWADLLIGAWWRAACVYRDAAAAAALIRPILARPQVLPSNTNPQAAVVALLGASSEADRWRIVAAEPEIAWTALPVLSGTPSLAEGRALLEHLVPALRDGFNPGGSPVAMLAARCVPPELREEAARRLARDHGLSKPAEAFLHALELRAELHAAFSMSPSSPRP